MRCSIIVFVVSGNPDSGLSGAYEGAGNSKLCLGHGNGANHSLHILVYGTYMYEFLYRAEAEGNRYGQITNLLAPLADG